MPVVDAATAEFYSRQASEMAARHESIASPVARFFGTAFATGSRVLDVGAASGRDLGELLASRYDAYGVEPAEALAALAVVHHPELAGRIARCAPRRQHAVQSGHDVSRARAPGRIGAASRAALVVARELGNLRIESIVLCNLALAVERLGRADEAQAQYEAAVGIARTLSATMMEGQFLGYLGLLHARNGRHDDAQRCLASGEAMLRSLSDAFGLGVLLTSRAEAHFLAGDAVAAKASLEAGAATAAEVGAGPASEIGLALARVSALIAPADP